MTVIIKIKEMLWAKWGLRKCSSVGPLPRLQGSVQVNNAGRIEIGERVRLRGTHVPIELGSGPDGVLSIGKNCSINGGASIAAMKRVTIGDNCMVGNYSLIMDSDFHDLEDRNSMGDSEPVTLEDDVWIAAGVTVLKGVTIGKGSAVMAGSVVVSNVPPYTLVGGVPARTIKSLAKKTEQPAPESMLHAQPTPEPANAK